MFFTSAWPLNNNDNNNKKKKKKNQKIILENESIKIISVFNYLTKQRIACKFDDIAAVLLDCLDQNAEKSVERGGHALNAF